MRLTLSIAAIVLAGPALAQATPDATAAPAATTPAATATAPAKPDVATGAKVVDPQGAEVGTIESVTNGVATLSTGTHRAGIPVGSFAQGDGKLVIALTKAQVDAQGAAIPAGATGATASAAPAGTAAASAAAGAPATTPSTGTAVAAAMAPATIAVGATVKDSTGAQVGTVKAVNGDMVTVASATASAQLPKKSFAQSGDSLVIGLTAAQFETAAKAAGGAKKS